MLKTSASYFAPDMEGEALGHVEECIELRRDTDVSLGLGIIADGGVVLAADSRGMYEGVSHAGYTDTYCKLTRLTKWTGACFAGDVHQGGDILNRTRALYPGEQNDSRIDEVTKTLERIGRPRYAGLPADKWPQVQIIVGGVEENGEAYLYSPSSTIGFAPSPTGRNFWAIGAITLAFYLDGLFHGVTLSLPAALRLAHYIMTETIGQHAVVGGPIRMATIDAGNGFCEVEPDQMLEIAAANSAWQKDMRASFG
jgi:20S proteasome alpha/beta subunit